LSGTIEAGTQRDLLGDHAAERYAVDVGALRSRGVEDGDRVAAITAVV